MYHRVADPVKGQPKPTWNVTPARFRKQLSGLLRRGYQAWPLRKVLEYQQKRLALPPRVFVVTFDDGYENNFTQALPILRELKIPATIFLATAFLGTNEPLPFDDWAAKGSPDVPADSWRPLSLDQCRELQASGLIELAAHTHTHQDFRGRLDELHTDLRTCSAFMREQFGIDQATFAFPYGTKKLGFSGPAMARVVRETGFLCSLTTEWELARLDGDRFDWGRFQVDQLDSPATIAGKLSGWYSTIRGRGKALLAMLKPAKKLPAKTSPAHRCGWGDFASGAGFQPAMKKKETRQAGSLPYEEYDHVRHRRHTQPGREPPWGTRCALGGRRHVPQEPAVDRRPGRGERHQLRHYRDPGAPVRQA